MSSEPQGIHSSWIENAEYWDTTVGQDGNKYWQRLQKPCLERLVPVQPGSRALDVATGNGLVARWLAGKGACVTASDGSEEMIRRAEKRSSPEQIQYMTLDVTSPAALAALQSAVRCPRYHLCKCLI
jgi:2-polyprenyl-3-methyl-5-hydroxy-6-metoxy-1,4-benzoquinol methylase